VSAGSPLGLAFARAHLFLCGGEPGLAACAKEFVEAAGGARGRVALLLQGGPRLHVYFPRYVTPWLESGLGSCDLVIPDEDGALNDLAALQVVQRASAIFVGGGSTPVYHRLYARSAVGAAIRARCEAGVPYGGLSAGMLIAGAVCPLHPDETGEAQTRLVDGLGLFEGLLCQPHFRAQDRLLALRAALETAGIPLGFGVEDEACLILAPGETPRVVGGRVTRVEAGMQRVDALHPAAPA
jgi:cyanophycinase